jgi:hypothetical protein
MTGFEKFVQTISQTMEIPQSYGIFHLISVVCTIVLTTLVCLFFKNASSKTFKIIVLVSWIFMVVLEVAKQIIFSCSDKGVVIPFSYSWTDFPYQLCSTPIYLLPFVIFMKEGKIRDTIMSFISTFALFGGLVVFVYPNDVFVESIVVNFQTMIHHGLQIVLGIYFMVYNRKKINIKYFLKGIIVFVILSVIAIILNLVVYNFITKDIFNMFFISPYFPQHLPVLSTVSEMAPYVVYLLAYLVGFVIAGYLVFIVQYGIIRLCSRGKKENAVT